MHHYFVLWYFCFSSCLIVLLRSRFFFFFLPHDAVNLHCRKVSKFLKVSFLIWKIILGICLKLIFRNSKRSVFGGWMVSEGINDFIISTRKTKLAKSYAFRISDFNHLKSENRDFFSSARFSLRRLACFSCLEACVMANRFSRMKKLTNQQKNLFYKTIPVKIYLP